MRKSIFSIVILISLAFLVSAEPDTLRASLREYFDSIIWTDAKEIAPKPLAEPFTLPEEKKSDVADFADTFTDEKIFPYLEGLDFIDYEAIPSDLLQFLSKLKNSFLQKKIDSNLCEQSRPFLSPLFNYRMERFPEITAACFGKPQMKANGSAIALYRLNAAKTGYYLVEITATQTQGVWKLFQFDVKGGFRANASQQN
ncbi:MAG: hypothetical protein P1P67_09145 [Treponema phagedenis]|uniref:DUF3828 domain-containing protein n=1 Tax=Treponema phagedenis TaxID=162 RepID=A0A0B7H2T9_TREPH|nr:hypothetical protein [Treponema phagedenis]NVP24142.1 hypothetical protein [Treponema phagedenis]QKS93450.1 hypothetical protein HPJ96_13485 [Treponema phagedenis]TYT78978.1 hypothetical protein FS559_07580 [Treponema phagedenis]CEM63291.1 conserved exported hypothetical protein [Treponema phagedenis]